MSQLVSSEISVKRWCYNRATVSLIIRKVLLFDIKYCDKNPYKIYNDMFTFKNFQKQNKIKIWILIN